MVCCVTCAMVKNYPFPLPCVAGGDPLQLERRWKINSIFAYVWKKLRNFWIICKSFCKCLHLKLFYKDFFWSFGLSYIFWVFFPSKTCIFLVKITNGSIFWKWKYDEWNTCEIFIHNVMEEEYEINPSLQIESSQNP